MNCRQTSWITIFVTLPAEQKYMVMKKSYCKRVESGTCNVCSAPCSSCMHFNRATSVMGSNVDGGYTAVKLMRDETDCCSFNVADAHPIYKSGACDDLQHAASESSNLLSVSSSLDSFSENAESKAALAPNATFDVSDDVEMPSKMFSGETGGKDAVLQKATSVCTRHLLSSSSYSASSLHQVAFTNQNEEQRQLECHGDNISCLTGGTDANGAVNLLNADVVRKETTHSMMPTKNEVAEGVKTETVVEVCHISLEREIKEDEIKSLPPSACLNEPFLQKKSLGSCVVRADFSSNSDRVDISALKVNSTKGEPSEYLKEKVEFSLGAPIVSSSIEGTMQISHPESKACQIKGNSSSGALESNFPRLESESSKETENTPNERLEDVQCSPRIEPSEKSSTPMETSKIQVSAKQHQQTNERENSVSDIEDVKVCDICGDAGREECLAICGRCSDGAEHIYCMRIMMVKVPEGEWLCEECKLKEDAENKKVDKTEELPAVSKFQSMKDKENSERTSNLKLLPKLEMKAADQEVKGVLKGIHSPKLSSKNHDENLEVFSMKNKRLSESNDGGTIGTASPRKRIALSRESSLKNLDAEKANPAKTGSSSVNQTVNSPKALARAQTSGSNPSKYQTLLQTSRGTLSRSFSFNNSGTKGKVKQLIEKIPANLKNPKEISPIDVRKDGVIRTMGRSASFRSVGSGRPGNEKAIKIQPFNSPRAEDSRAFKQLKERNSLEKKSSFKLDHTFASPSSMLNTGVPSKLELKPSHYDGKSNNMSETNNPGPDKGSDDSNDTGCNEGKKRLLNAQKSFGSRSLNSCSSECQKPSMLPLKEGVRTCVDSSNIHTEAVPLRGLPQAAESSLRDEKMKDSSFSSGSRQVGATSCRLVRCQKCNETGHATQHCSIDKFRVSALKPSADRCSKEWTSKNCKWKDAVEAVVSKTKMQKNIRSLDQPQESAVASEVESINISPNCSSSARNLTSLESTSDQPEAFRSSDAGPGRTGSASNIKQQGMHLVEASTGGTGESNSNLEKLTVKSFGQMHPDCASALEDPLRVSAFPELEFIWQGDFEVLGSARLPEPFNGVQAHLSTCASPKVLEVVTKFPGKVKLEEISSGNTWPLQFLRTSPKEDNIALFFFAKDIESYEKTYKKLVENMLKNDLALKGIIDGVELLIFPSTKLPEKSQRWNNLFFLWGVFRERSIDCLNSVPSLPKPCKSSLEIEPLAPVSVCPMAPEVSTSRKIDLHEILEKTSPKFEISQQAKAAAPSSDVDMLPVSISGDKNMIFQTQTRLLIQASGPTAGPLQTHMKSCPDSGVQMNTPQLGLEQECVVTHMGNLGSDPEGERGVGQQHNAQFSDSKYDAMPSLPVDWTLKNGREGSECGFWNKEMREKSARVKNDVLLDNDQDKLLPTVDHLSCEPKPLRKRVSSWLVDTAAQVSGETSKTMDGTKLWKDSLNLTCLNNDRENKKMKFYAEEHVSRCGSVEENMSGRLSSKINPLLGSFANEQLHTDSISSEPTMMAESSRSAERYVFPVDLNSVCGVETENVIHVLSSDDEDAPENNSPDLELALGGKKQPAKQEMLPLFFPLFDRRNNQNKMRVDHGDDDVPASLSLSLGFPVLEKEQKAKPLPRTEQLLPNTSLLLFGGFNDI
ncbi:Zinc finger RING/FYVE/PHD-type protein [Dioscorea alata]|uniref:Zinc finger RING/FYVE/PHD-type protein n=1 Tax=Dioscorea alata TaxID=55571 RepID=A0ACB7WHY0_DIOAL|nr:Zinc finger RING/FYVE/PHD-type protein [Dioscorea alata]